MKQIKFTDKGLDFINENEICYLFEQLRLEENVKHYNDFFVHQKEYIDTYGQKSYNRHISKFISELNRYFNFGIIQLITTS